MKSNQTLMDSFAIGLSFMCTLHCFATPIILTLLPTLGASFLENEQFHLWMLVAVIPSSLLALSLGCNKHKQVTYILVGVVGMIFLMAAVFVDEKLLGTHGEKALTLVGSVLIAVTHWLNYRQCKIDGPENCLCSKKD
ncbi:MerC domain-containing protein [Pseudoalteromonas sp. AOP31-A2-14]|uniref:MerC domain-containing protein n=1 Tax=Pseudoalteromonas sp. AOP31-A2-14 TaxID=3457695 RepID=UPI003FB7BE00